MKLVGEGPGSIAGDPDREHGDQAGETLRLGAAPGRWAGSGATAWQAFAVFMLALLVRLIGNSSLPAHTDEFFHFLAAQSWAENGSFAILDGAYSRAWGYTALIGLTFDALDQSSLLVARLPALLAGALLVPAVFLWTKANVSLRAAWIAALLLCFADVAIAVSQFARFYSLQALLGWAGSVAVYGALHRSGNIKLSVLLLAGAAACFLAALHLQITTLILLASLGLYVAGYTASRPPVLLLVSQKRHWPWLAAGGLLLLVLAIVALMRLPIVNQFRDTSLWAQEHQDDVLYYVRIFFDRLLLLTLIFPFAVWLVISRRSQAGLFCLALFLVPFVAHSLAGMKSIRYLAYALPFFFVLIAIAIDFLLSALAPVITSMLAAAERRRWIAVPARLRPMVVPGILVLATAVVIAGNRAEAHGLKRLALESYRAAKNPAVLVREPPDRPWTGAARHLRAAIGSPSLLIVGDDMRTVHYLGPFDLLLHRSRITDISPEVEFGRDFRTGRRVVGSGLTLTAIADCYPDGVILVPDERWGTASSTPRDVTVAIEAFAHPIRPGVEGFHLFRWQHAESGANCGQLRAKVEDHSAP